MIPVSLNHIALDVADRQRSIEFYAELLGAEVVAEDVEHKLTFLRLPGSDHYSDLALHEHADVTRPTRPTRCGWPTSGGRSTTPPTSSPPLTS